MSLNIDVELDGHTLPVDPAVVETLKGVLLDLGVESGNFDLHYGLVKKGAKHQPGVKYLGHTGGGMQVTIRPGNHSMVVNSNLVVRRPNTADDIARRFIQKGRFIPYMSHKAKRRRRKSEHPPSTSEVLAETSPPITLDTHYGNRLEINETKELAMRKANLFINDIFRFHSREVKATMGTLWDLFGSRDVDPRIITQSIIVTLERHHRLYLKRNTPEEILKGFVDHGHVEVDPGGITARIIVPTQEGSDLSCAETDQERNRRILAIGTIATLISTEMENAREIIELEKDLASKREERLAIEAEVQTHLLHLEETRTRLKNVELDIARVEDALDTHPGKEVVGLLRKIKADVLAIEQL